MARLGLGFLQRGKKEGEREEGVTGCSFIRRGGPWSKEEAGEAMGARRPWHQCFSWRHSERGMTGGSPLSGIFLFLFLQKFQ